MTGPRVVLAEDDVLLREGLASLLGSSGYEVVGQAGDGSQLLALARETGPDLVVADIRMPPTHTTEGLEAARVIRQERPDTAILVLSAYAEVQHAMELLAGGGGIGDPLKSRIADVEEFLDTLQRIARGGSVVDPALVRELVTARLARGPACCAFGARTRGSRPDGRRNAPTPASHGGSSSPGAPSRNTSAASSPSSTCTTPTMTTAASSP